MVCWKRLASRCPSSYKTLRRRRRRTVSNPTQPSRPRSENARPAHRLAWVGAQTTPSRWIDVMSAERGYIGALGLRSLIVWLAIFGGALYGLEEVAGWPALPMLPDSRPTWVQVDVWVRSPFASIEVLE